MDGFLEALVGSREISTAEPYSLFGRLVGEWDFEHVSGRGTDRERHVPGEWIFSWILDGKVMQDLFICPSRRERLTNPQPDAAYGTAVRFYNHEKQKWDVCYGCDGKMRVLEAEPVGDDIVLTRKDLTDCINQWMFTEITPVSFHWLSRISTDGGKTWVVDEDVYAIRRV